ncbi:ABC transporter permease, partial [Oscillatoria amoena NRMC-F 0135]|nr:ABC transporter permease [Oscillatoria amoena NRMC-F 0135]
MFKNYFKVAFRSLVKQRIYSSINIFGLSVGIASCLLITLFVTNELSYDRFHANADRIYKIALERKYPNHATYYAIIPHSYAVVIPQDFPEVESAVRMGGPFNDVLVTYEKGDEEIQFEEDFIMAADSNFFSFFNIHLIKGDPQRIFSTTNDIVLTESTAKRYFGNDEPIDKTIRFFNQDFKVTGVSEDIRSNSHMKFDFLVKWNDEIFGGSRSNFITFSAHTYLLLKPGTTPQAVEAKFPKLVDTYASAQIESDLGKSWEDYKKEGNGYRYFLQPLPSIHLDPTNIEAKMQPGGNINYVYFLIGVAILIVVIACINFMNLATARSAERAREVGVRKTMGSMKNQLISQFLIESMLICFIATILALLWVQLAIPGFNSLAQKNLVLEFSPLLALGLTGLILIVGFLAGSYPAFVLSGFNPVVVMKGNFTGSSGGSWLRSGLVVFQFLISISLIIGTLVISRQMEFMQNKSLGFDREQVLLVERAFALQAKTQTFLDEVRKLAEVERAGGSFAMLGRQGDFFGAQFQAEGSSEILTTKSMAIEDGLAETIGFEFVEGRGYSRETRDSLSIILNETAVKTLGLRDPVGQKLNQVQRRPEGTVIVPFTIIGVIKDFNFQSLRDPITPLTIQSTETFGPAVGYVYVRIKSNSMQAAIQNIETLWKEMVPDQPFKYSFLDQNLNANYEAEQRAGAVFGTFSVLAICIACVGLFGLAAYTASLRTKEIGIRKVLGASVSSVVFLLSKDFTKLILIAFIMAVPISWYLMSNWLDGFAYRISLDAGTFLLAGLLAVAIAWITVSYQSIKAAIANPVKSLRSE